MIDLPTRVIPRANNGRKFDEKDSSKPAIFDWLKNPWQLLSLPLLLYITIPLVAIFIQTPLSDLFQTIKRTQVVQAVTLSLVTSLSTTVITWVIGSPVAYLLAQRRSRFHRVIDSLVDLPTVLPPAVAGVALLMAYGRRGLFGPVLTGLGINIPFTMLAVIMAQTFIASPLYIKSAAVGFSSVDDELRQAAALDGANRWQVFYHIEIPLAWVGLVSGSVMTWARAMGEFGATIIFAGNFPNRTQTMPLAIYIGFELDMNVALTLAIILINFSFLTLTIIKGLLYRK